MTVYVAHHFQGELWLDFVGAFSSLHDAHVAVCHADAEEHNASESEVFAESFLDPDADYVTGMMFPVHVVSLADVVIGYISVCEMGC